MLVVLVILIVATGVIWHLAEADSPRKVESRKRVDNTWHHPELPSFKPMMHTKVCNEPQKQRLVNAYDMLDII